MSIRINKTVDDLLSKGETKERLTVLQSDLGRLSEMVTTLAVDIADLAADVRNPCQCEKRYGRGVDGEVHAIGENDE